MSSSKREEYARLLRPLHYAVLMRDCDAIRNQLKHRADVIAQNQDGDTALHMLCYPILTVYMVAISIVESHCLLVGFQVSNRLHRVIFVVYSVTHAVS